MSLDVAHPWVQNYDKGVPATIDIPPVTLPEMLAETARRFPDRPACFFFGKVLSYREIDEAATRFAAALAAEGIKPGERVAILLANCPQFLISYYGILRAGAIVVTCSPAYVEHELEHQLRDSGSQAIVVLDVLYDKVRNVRRTVGLKTTIVTGVQDYLPGFKKLLYPIKNRLDGTKIEVDRGPGIVSWNDFLGKAPSQAPKVPLKQTDLALLQYTGGTTGVAKGAMLSHRNLVANAYQTKAWMPDIKDGYETILCVLPFFHVYGMTTCLNLGVAAGARLILIPKFDRSKLDEFLGMIAKEKPTLFPGVPPIYAAINNFPQAKEYGLSSIRACISGAMPLLRETQEQFEALTGARLVEGYGLTESSPVTHANPIHGQRKIGIGLPFPNVEVKLVNPETGKQVGVGERGELCLQGPNIMQGYWKMEEETANVLKDGWLHTGDVAVMDEEGYFQIVDRIKEMIIASGFNIYPRDVEEVLAKHPKVLEVAVGGLPDKYRGETVKAYIVLREGETATPEEMIEFCKKELAAYKVPTLVEFKESLPKSLIGKVLRRVLVEEDKKKMAAS